MLRFAPAVAKPSDFPIFGSHFTLQTGFSVSDWVATHALVSIDQTLTFPSNDLFWYHQSNCTMKWRVMYATYPLRRYSPVLLQASDKTHDKCPGRFATCSPDEVSNNTMTLESPAAARSFPAGENATVRTGFTRPAKRQRTFNSRTEYWP